MLTKKIVRKKIERGGGGGWFILYINAVNAISLMNLAQACIGNEKEKQNKRLSKFHGTKHSQVLLVH